ncbi:MAG: cupin domain-containing protein [SAR324 cluster bacterium]|uniref:Cupin domain-containing protein n=1 Tax=SAR324 cluster bacterium TaxID=2024889 RepID=A0A7X9IJ36_9DELT|nr:cupin domain-containing protein [SAR324 cluster bacterium]
MNRQSLEAGKPFNLKNSVEYSNGSIVSKTLINKDSLTLTLFAFDLGQGLSEHSAPFDALVEVIDGAVELKIGGEVVNAKAGDLVLMPANIPHSVKAVERFKMLLTMVRA